MITLSLLLLLLNSSLIIVYRVSFHCYFCYFCCRRFEFEFELELELELEMDPRRDFCCICLATADEGSDRSAIAKTSNKTTLKVP